MNAAEKVALAARAYVVEHNPPECEHTYELRKALAAYEQSYTADLNSSKPDEETGDDGDIANFADL